MSDLVVISLEPWDEVWRRNQHLVAGLLRAGHVSSALFVEPAADPVHAAMRGRRSPMVTRRGPIDLDGAPSGCLRRLRLSKVLPRRWDSRGDARRARAVVREASRHLATTPVLWVNDPGGAQVAREVDWPALYDITDDWLLAPRPEAQHARLREQEDYLMRRCAQVVVCSPALVRTKSSPGRSVRHIPNAVEPTVYRESHTRPDDLPSGPVALYLGTAHTDRIDLEVCLATARAVPATLVLVGPAPLPPAQRRVLEQAGVVLLGPRPSHRVPAYLQHADVLVVPHLLTPFTESLDPIKAYEYRAAGRPVVATRVPGFREVADPLVQAVDAADFPQAVFDSLTRAPRSGELPQDIPAWSQRVEQMAEVIEQVRDG